MKKLFCILILQFFYIWSYAQETLTFKISNPRILHNSSKDYLQFDVLVSASAAGTYLYSSQVIFYVNGTSFVTSGGPFFTKGFIDGQYTPFLGSPENKYTTVINWNSGNMNLSIFSNPNFNGETLSGGAYTLVPIIPEVIGTVTAEISNSSGIAGISIKQEATDGYQKYATGVSPYYSEYYASPNNYNGKNLSNLFLGRIYSNSVWTQIGGTVDWSSPVNTSVWDGNATIPTSGESGISTLRIHNGATLTVPATGKLTVLGTTEIIPSSDGLAVESNSAETGSVIFGSAVSGNVTYSRYVTGVAGLTDNWHLVTSTSTDQTIANFISGNSIEKIGTKNGFAPYNNLSGSWDYFDDSSIPTTVFPSGKGYEILSASSGNILFKGNPFVTDYSTAITSPAEGNNWNLIGNSYLSAIHAKTNSGSVNDFLNENALKLNENYRVVYLWNAATGNYEIISQITGDNYIAPGQAFFVYAEAGSNLDFTTSMRTHQPGAVFKNGTIANPHLKLFAENKDRKINTEIFYLDAMSTGLDPGYDAGRFGLSDNSFALYTKLVGGSHVEFSIQCLPGNNFENMIIPIGLNTPAGTDITFSIETENIPAEINIYLEDRELNVYTKLSTQGSNYSLMFNKQYKGTGRFYLHTKENITRVEDIKTDFEIIMILAQQKIQLKGTDLFNSHFWLFGIDGKILMHKKLTEQNINEITMTGIKSGIYIVQTKKEGSFNRKKIAWIKR